MMLPSVASATAVMQQATRKSSSSELSRHTSGTRAKPKTGTMPKTEKEANMVSAPRTLLAWSCSSGIGRSSSSFIMVRVSVRVRARVGVRVRVRVTAGVPRAGS